ncbi:MAG TPA: hypothetical protein VNW06_04890 [Cytophagaceae bacterium]|jgi:hypothetical protein|nr:hypothetical protein [Cytophagaceae bacterium]
MKILPSENIIYKSKLQKDEIINGLIDFCEPINKKSKTIIKKPYKGEINKMQFKMQRIVRFSQTSHTIIRGELQQYDNETIIKVKIRPSEILIIFLCMIFGCMVYFFIKFLIMSINETSLNFHMLRLFGSFLLMYFAILSDFKYESHKFKKIFTEYLELVTVVHHQP